MSYFKKRAASFGYAVKGIKVLVATQPHFRFHVIVAIIVVISGYFTGLSTTEWLFVILAIGMVIIAESVNTAIEFAIDLFTAHHHPIAGKAKDTAAAAVLIAAIFAVIIGLVIFVPKWIVPMFVHS